MRRYEKLSIYPFEFEIVDNILDCSVRASLDGLSVEDYHDYFHENETGFAEGDPFVITWGE